MPDITSPQLVSFANTRVRPTVDVAEQLYQTCVRFVQEWDATGGASIPNTADLFADGSDADGRKRMSGQLAVGIKGLADAMLTWFGTNATIGGVTKTRIQHLQGASTNGQARF